jgi:hypothetical protein
MTHDAEFGRYDHPIAHRLEHTPDQLLIMKWPIHVRRIEEVDPEFDCSLERCGRFAVVTLTIKVRHSHASQAQFRYHQPLTAELTLMFYQFAH